MIVLPVAFCLAVTVQPVDVYALQVYQGNFVVRKNQQKDTVPIKLPPAQPELARSYRRDKVFVVWDERGLTTRIGNEAYSTFLPDLAVSPKVFERDQILETLRFLEEGKRSKNANGLSGSVRVGTAVYWLPRWNQKDGVPWLEALVRVDMTKPRPKPEYLGRFAGLSLAERAIDDKLFVFQGKLAAVVRQRGVWGLGTYDVAKNTFDFLPMGASLVGYRPISSRFGLYLERTSYGTQVAGKVDWVTQSRRILVETRGNLRIAEALGAPILTLTEAGHAYVVNAETGARQMLPASSAVRASKFGLVVWSPFDQPRRAWLYDPERFRVLAKMPAVPLSER